MVQEAQLINFKQLVGLFLAEIIRSRRTSLGRAAEIANRVLKVLPNMRTENDALATLTEIEKDFGEIAALKQVLHFGYKDSDIKVYEREIKEYASLAFDHDIQLSAAFLQDASKSTATIQELCLKYPEFCKFLLAHSDKARLVGAPVAGK